MQYYSVIVYLKWKDESTCASNDYCLCVYVLKLEIREESNSLEVFFV